MQFLRWQLAISLVCIVAASSASTTQADELPAHDSNCQLQINITNSLSTISIEGISVTMGNDSGVTDSSVDGVNINHGNGIDVSNSSISGSGVTFNSVNVTGIRSGSDIDVSNDTNVSITNLNVSTGGVSQIETTQTPLPETPQSVPVGPRALYDPSSGEMSFTGLRDAHASNTSIAIFLESLLPSIQYCTVGQGDAEIFIPGDLQYLSYAGAEKDFLLWYYDDAASLPETLHLGKVVEPGTPSETLNFLYWTSDLEFNFPFDRSAAFTGSTVVVPESQSFVLIAVALLVVIAFPLKSSTANKR